MHIGQRYSPQSTYYTFTKDKERNQEELIEFQHLPGELCFKIFSFLSPKDSLIDRSVNHRWKNLLEDDQLWQRYGVLGLEAFVMRVQNFPNFYQSDLLNYSGALSMIIFDLFKKSNKEIENMALEKGIDHESLNTLTTREKLCSVVYLLTGLLTKEHVDAFPTDYHLKFYVSDNARPLVESRALTAEHLASFRTYDHLSYYVNHPARFLVTIEQAAAFPTDCHLNLFLGKQARPLVESGALTAEQTAAFHKISDLKAFISNEARPLVESGALTAEKAVTLCKTSGLKDFITESNISQRRRFCVIL